jgi:hypothetical protein
MGNIISLKLHGKWDIAVAHLSSQFKKVTGPLPTFKI